ncbi:CehA/McbA family metallohydrolase [Photobacterium swingsii]|uniref:CehA/McbA family metallohydrolase n=1 Tax=Photobacterium swingsii TaxID=680026 RepID=UPI00352E17FB
MLKLNGELPFGHRKLVIDVPANTQAITLSGTTVKKGFMYAYLFDANQRLRGCQLWQKAQKHLTLTAHNASLGGIAGELPAGEWQLHLYNLEGEDRTPKAMQYLCEVECEVECEGAFEPQPEPNDLMGLKSLTPSLTADNTIAFDYSKMKRTESAWYSGDLHAHTCLSDGHNSLATAAEIIKQQGLDFFFLTEHNICHPMLPDLDNVLMLPAVEVTTDKGHFNVHGPKRGLDMRDADYSSAALIQQGLSLIDEDQKAGGVQGSISINHPMMKPWHWHYNEMELAKVNTLEVCCDPTWATSPQATEEALTVLSAMWNAGHRIAGVGGSDSHLAPHERNPQAHEPSLYGDPMTYVYAHGLSGESILAGLRAGQVYVERGCGLAFEINQGDMLPGQAITSPMMTYRLSVEDEFHDYFVELIADGKVIGRHPLKAHCDGVTELNIDMTEHAWLRLDIRRAGRHQNEREFIGLINPVFNPAFPQFSKPTLATWGELVDTLST